MDFKSSVHESMKNFAKKMKTPRNSVHSSEQSSLTDFSSMDLDNINKYYKSILTQPHEETIVYRPILAEKIMPKKPIP